MTTFLLLVWLKGQIVLQVQDVPSEKSCYTLMEQVEPMLPKWNKYTLTCYRIE